MILRYCIVLALGLAGTMVGAAPVSADIGNLKVTATTEGGDFGDDSVTLRQVDSLALTVTFTTSLTQTAGQATAVFVDAPAGIQLTCEETTAEGDLRRTFKCLGIFPADTFLLFEPTGFILENTVEAIDEFTGESEFSTRPMAVNIDVPDIDALTALLTRLIAQGEIAGPGSKGLVNRLQRRLIAAQNALDASASRAVGKNLAEFRLLVKNNTSTRDPANRAISPAASSVLRLDANVLIALFNPNR